jgi:hypothetical protein
LLDQLPGVIGLPLLQPHEARLFQCGEVAALPVALFPLRRGTGLRWLRRVAVQALPEDGIGAELSLAWHWPSCSRARVRSLRDSQSTVPGRALQFVAQALHQGRVVALAGQFPQLLALFGMLQLFGRQTATSVRLAGAGPRRWRSAMARRAWVAACGEGALASRAFRPFSSTCWM